MRYFFIFLIIPLTLMASSFHTKEESEQNSLSVVKVFVHSLSPNYFKPWNAGKDSSSTGSGVIIDGNLILTAAHVVTDATYIEVKKHADPKKYFANVKWIAHDADLALIEVDDKSFFKGTVSKTLGAIPNRQEGVAVYGYPEGGNKISITQGIISRIEHTDYIHSNIELLTIQIDAAINSGNSGGPAFNNKGEIIGIAIQTLSNSNNIGYIAPVQVIQHFFNDIKDGKYDGFPASGLFIQTMENQDLKDYYGMEDKSGVLVGNIIRGSSADGYLKKEDIILEIDGHDIADDNTAEIKGIGRISANYLIKQHYVGDVLNIKALRNKQEIDLKIPLKESTEFITHNYKGNPKYYIFGGLVFMPLTSDYYLNMASVPDGFTYEYVFTRLVETGFKQKEVVFISTLLEDKINAGYSVSYSIVRKINDEDVDSFDDLVKKIKSSGKNVKITVIDGDVFILDKDKAMQAEARILERYGIQKASCLIN